MSAPPIKGKWLLVIGLAGLVLGVFVAVLGFKDVGLWSAAIGLASIGAHSVKEQNSAIDTIKSDAVDSAVQDAAGLSATNTGSAQGVAGSGQSSDLDAEIIAEAERLSTTNKTTISSGGGQSGQPGS